MTTWSDGWGDERRHEDAAFEEQLARQLDDEARFDAWSAQADAAGDAAAEEADRRAAILEDRWEAQRDAAGLER